MSASAITLKSFTWTWLALLLLAGLSFWLSRHALGAWEMPIALAIAALKAVLVLLIFMELIASSFVPRLVIVVLFAGLTLLLSLMVLDVLTRQGPALRPPVSGVVPAH